MRYDEAYANVDKGLLEAPEDVRSAYLNRPVRYIIEALLIDPETPDVLYLDLLGWTKDMVNSYRKYFFCIPESMPRIPLFQFIQSAPTVTDGDVERKSMLIGVYEYGWSYIDSLYNRGNRVSIQGRALHSLKKMFGQVDRMVVDCLKNPTTANLQPLIKLMKEAIQVEASTKVATGEQLSFQFVEDIKNEAAASRLADEKIMGLEFDELRKLKPASENKAVQTELNEILKDVKDQAG